MRPMLLNYINDFVEADRNFNYSYEIYEVLIEKWIESESKKSGIRKKYGSEGKYRKLLLDFFPALAINLYEKREARGGFFISKEELIKNPDGLQISDIEADYLTEIEIRSKSLLSRKANGKYKFSHKSILEYFLAKELIKNDEFRSTFEFNGKSEAEIFLNEIVASFRELSGSFNTTGTFYPLSELTKEDINKAKKLRIEKLEGFNLSNLSLFANIEELIIFDKENFKLLYDLYFVFFNNSRLREQLKQLKKTKSLELIEFLEQREQAELLELLELPEAGEGRKLQELLKLLEQRERIERIKQQESLEPELSILEQESPRSIELKRMRETILETTNEKIIKTLQPIEDFLEDMKSLQEKLPNCKMIY